MCKVMEDLRDESFAEGREEGRMEQARLTAQNLKLHGLTPEQIAGVVSFDIETVRK